MTTNHTDDAPLTPRQRSILAELERRGFISTMDLAETFSVSDMTVRRDTRELSQRGLVRVVHGGVITVGGRLGRSGGFGCRIHRAEYGCRRGIRPT